MKDQAVRLLEKAVGEMEVYCGQRSERWQDSERAEALSETMESLAEIAAALRDLDTI